MLASSTRRPIQILPEAVIHKIAAGEVVERPASVVKELVENSLDAGATRIRIELEQGGIRSIIVEDNGQGIPECEIPLALTRHATSKIRLAEELFSLNTLGFRGEALASIAGVSRFQLETATAESEPIGYSLTTPFEEGPGVLQQVSMEKGTRISVKDLFYSTPARLKFLKRPETEWSHVYDLISSLSLAHPEVEWVLIHNKKKVLHCPPVRDLRERVLDLFGKEFYQALYSVERDLSGIQLSGLLGHPNFSKASNRHLFFFVNGRVVQDRLLQHALLTGYRGLLMTQQYPAAILFLEIDPSLVDVNVHPTKKEIRFSNSQAIHHLISETVRRRLEEAPWKLPSEIDRDSEKNSDRTSSHLEFLPQSMPRPLLGLTENFRPQENKKNSIQGALQEYWDRQNGHGSTAQPSFSARIGTIAFSDLHLIGQFNCTYLICAWGESLVLIDQHAAHERIGFEKLSKEFRSGNIPQQRLLHPQVFDLSESESIRLRSILNSLLRFGFEIEEFGEKTFALKAHPQLLNNSNHLALLKELTGQEAEEGGMVPLEDRIDHVLATMACHRQIRAGDSLQREEMIELLRSLEGTPRSYHCPHGRPVMVEIEGREIEKWFKRVL